MKKAKKILVMVAALALTAAIAIGGTLAYLTSKTEVVKNTFTVGKVEITLDEADVKPDGSYETTVDSRVNANEYHLMPGHTYIKDPVIHVSDASETAWLFVKVVNGISAIEAVTEPATSIAAQMTANGWSLLNGSSDTYAYYRPVAAGEDIATFSNFTIGGEQTDLAAYVSVDANGNETSAKIEVTAYAVQQDGFASAAAAWEDAPASWN